MSPPKALDRRANATIPKRIKTRARPRIWVSSVCRSTGWPCTFAHNGHLSSVSYIKIGPIPPDSEAERIRDPQAFSPGVT